MEGFFLSLILLIGMALGTLVYFLPSIIAFRKKKVNLMSIVLLNFFLGWSLIGWVVSLVWATSNDAPVQQVIVQNNIPNNTDNET